MELGQTPPIVGRRRDWKRIILWTGGGIVLLMAGCVALMIGPCTGALRRWDAQSQARSDSVAAARAAGARADSERTREAEAPESRPSPVEDAFAKLEGFAYYPDMAIQAREMARFIIEKYPGTPEADSASAMLPRLETAAAAYRAREPVRQEQADLPREPRRQEQGDLPDPRVVGLYQSQYELSYKLCSDRDKIYDQAGTRDLYEVLEWWGEGTKEGPAREGSKVGCADALLGRPQKRF